MPLGTRPLFFMMLVVQTLFHDVALFELFPPRLLCKILSEIGRKIFCYIVPSIKFLIEGKSSTGQFASPSIFEEVI